ncbi:MAG TPA: phospholipase D-like domain-containing protein [Candidatus Paceibacterota bacterium]|nr:phospholipase D-like domain-containing protein [Candidatus Paceibacterota bacterium]
MWSPNSADTLIALISSATSTLEVYNEEMADPRIEAALTAAAARGVAVRVDMTYATNWKAALQSLAAAGVTVRTYASSAKFYIHAKVIVADGSEAFVGSENFSAQSLDSNRELGILIRRPDILQSLETTFDADWAGSRPFNN